MSRRDAEPLLVDEIDEGLKAEYIELIYAGKSPKQAARACGSTGSQFRKLRSEKSQWYEPAFAEEYKRAISSETRKQAILERLRDLVWDKAEEGDVRVLEKLSLIYDPDWETLRHQNLNVNVQIQVLRRLLPNMSDEELERHIEDLRAATPVKALPPAA